jgi:DNA-binding HxlR family transcriptional regulator
MQVTLYCYLHDASCIGIDAMQLTRFDGFQCPIARSIERVGEWWSILILRDAMQGLTRFDDFQKSLGIASNMLSRRLNKLVDAGLLERRQYSERPQRFEYILTERGRDFRPVLWTLLGGVTGILPRRARHLSSSIQARATGPTRLSLTEGAGSGCGSLNSAPSPGPPRAQP